LLNKLAEYGSVFLLLETSSFDSLQSFRRRRRNQLGMEIATLLNKKLLNEGGNDINLVNEKK